MHPPSGILKRRGLRKLAARALLHRPLVVRPGDHALSLLQEEHDRVLRRGLEVIDLDADGVRRDVAPLLPRGGRPRHRELLEARDGRDLAAEPCS